MSEQNLRGVFAIPVTPFTEDGQLDIESLDTCVDFCLDHGSHGIVMPVNASEISTLTDQEWERVISAGISRVNSRVPFVAGISGNSLEHSVERARKAQDFGAGFLMAMPPGTEANRENIKRFYEEVADSVQIPIWIQNNKPPKMVSIPTDVCIDLLRNVPNIKYLKEESEYPGHVMSKVLEEAGESCKSIMGGLGGRFLLDEFRRGSAGTMPAGHYTDLQVKIWKSLEKGKRNDDGTREITREARCLWEKLLPSLNFEFMFGVTAYKLIFWKRGVISSPATRIPTRRPFDDKDMLELDEIMKNMQDVLDS